jgi:photosystem II stability/assembly factor-like uncharacterized protein
MHLRSTLLLLIAALTPVTAAFLTRPRIEMPPAPALPVTWSRAEADSGASTGKVTSVAGNRVLRSRNGGRSWQTLHVSQRALHHAATNGDLILVAGAGTVLRSVDDGATWTAPNMPVRFNAYDVAFASTQAAFVVGGIGQLMQTHDAGASWTYATLPTRALVNAIAVVNPATLVIVGSDGAVLRTDDGGRTWRNVASGTTQHLRDVVFADAQHGVAVGMWGTALVTNDGGQTWTLENPGTQAHLISVEFRNGAAVATASDSTVVRRNSNAN